ncbi:cupin-like domain-containing protein [Lysobacter sp. SG-8]|uniref:Cupin-like domain-containing protein n=1 Tax=Marilutibacter penaei TaxID=2759900 RepID=A0A7W3YD53_9GAMM|nr:cupin-like domain-containing protein [Lysobacter penaei]MBB1086988.1 cupin-like domain-containing protein [Lysobacter penaei]
MLAPAEAIEERHGLAAGELPDEVLDGDRPVVLRGAVAHWPMVGASRGPARDAAAYLNGFRRADAPPVVATVGPPSIQGRFFYNDDLSGFNFRQEQVPLHVVLGTLLKYETDPAPPAIYVGSTSIDTWLPGFRSDNALDFGPRDPLASIWIGNRTRIAPHQDVPDNLACVVAGRRRFTLFPPEQLRNLYVGPLDFTPAGQPISLVDLDAPDLERFPRFAEAMAHARVVELQAGDAIFIPSLWWHQIEALDAFNVLVNYWWRRTPAWMDTPMNALMLALATVRDLPPAQRAAWQDAFNHYVFEPGDATAGHIPDTARRSLGPFDERRAKELREWLRNRLDR